VKDACDQSLIGDQTISNLIAASAEAKHQTSITVGRGSANLWKGGNVLEALRQQV
jgi:hypothetical protein